MYQSQSINPSQMNIDNHLSNSQQNNLDSNVYNPFHSSVKKNINYTDQSKTRLTNNDNKTEIFLNIK